MAITRLQALLQERADLTAEARTVFATAATESRDLTDDERAADDTRDLRLQEIGRAIALEERQAARETAVGNRQPSDNAPRVSGGHDRAGDMPWGYELGVRRIVGADGVPKLGGVPKANEVALGHCLQAIFRARDTGVVDARLIQAAGPSGGNTSVPSEGGFSVGTDLSLFLFQMGMEASKLLPYCNTITISAGSDSIEAPYVLNASRATGSRFGGVRVYRKKEAATVVASFINLEELFELRLADLMGIAYQSDRLVNDAAAMGAMYSTAFRNEFAFTIDNEIIRGDGVGEFQGVTNSAAFNSTPKETGQAAATITNQNISDMWVRIWLPSRSRGVWVGNPEIGPQLDNLYIPAGTAALEPRFVSYGADGIMRIKGRPYVEIEQAEALGTIGDFMFLDLAEYVVITKGALEQAESDHVRFLYNERTFRWTQRINGKSPWRTAVAPFKGSINISPFVGLATRS